MESAKFDCDDRGRRAVEGEPLFVPVQGSSEWAIAEIDAVAFRLGINGFGGLARQLSALTDAYESGLELGAEPSRRQNMHPPNPLRLCENHGCSAPAHYENCSGCLGFGLRADGKTPITAAEAEDPPSGWLHCLVCGSPPSGAAHKHPEYGPCDQMGAAGQCSECRKIAGKAIFSLTPKEEIIADLNALEMKWGLRAEGALARRLAELAYEVNEGDLDIRALPLSVR